MGRGVADTNLDLDRLAGLEPDRRHVHPRDQLGHASVDRLGYRSSDALRSTSAAGKKERNQGDGSAHADQGSDHAPRLAPGFGHWKPRRRGGQAGEGQSVWYGVSLAGEPIDRPPECREPHGRARDISTARETLLDALVFRHPRMGASDAARRVPNDAMASFVSKDLHGLSALPGRGV